MKAVVTGGAGFIGSNLVDLLVEEGFEVVVYDNLITGKKEYVNKKAQLKLVDIKNGEAVSAAAKIDFPNTDVVFHLAALPRVEPSIHDPVHFHETNVNGTINILWACKNYGVKKIVYSSSSSVYGNAEILPITEETPVNPMSPYALQKLFGDQYAKLFCDLYGMNITCLRYFNVYGNREPNKGAYVPVVGIWFRQFMAGEPLSITSDGLQSRDFINVLDVAKANLVCCQSNSLGYQVFNVGSGRNQKLSTLAKLISDNITYIAPRTEPKHTCANISKLSSLGWKPEIKIEDYILTKKSSLLEKIKTNKNF